YVAATRAQDYLIVSGSLHRAGENSWLRQWLAALGVLDEDLILPDDSVPADDTALINFGWGQCTLTIPRVPPAPDDLMPGSPAAESSPGLGFLDAETAAPVLPPLLADVPFERDAPARALTATQIAKLGHAPYYDPAAQGLAAFRHSVLFDMPEPVRPLVDRTALPDDHRLRRVIGEIVHQALQAWLLPDAADPAVLMQRLETIAWQLGLSDPDHIRLAISRALDLLRRFEGSDVRADLDRASQVYRELPFMYWTGRRMIHGVIDVLYHMPVKGGQWHVMDYKTALVSQAGAYANAKRYYLQVGVYAKAVEAKTGQLPETHLYYIHPGQRVYVKPAYWQAALDRLEDDIRAALAVEQVDEG
ncbi:MAG: PD-(D/E)XK nuclease family protein, partial [Anaerolineae bacterium]|nr:PD-(D/E)XK nuclease family protein [Anaerolineae bacterium]